MGRRGIEPRTDGLKTQLWQQRLFGATFAFSSLVTPFFLGTVAGAIASSRVPPGIAAGELLSSWLNPTSAMSGLLAVVTAAYLAAVYLTRDAERGGGPDLAGNSAAGRSPPAWPPGPCPLPGW